MAIRGVRGAVNVNVDEPEEVIRATRELLDGILETNVSLHPEDVVSVLFTATPDLRSVYPAQAARAMGWDQVPLLCFQEMTVEGSMPRVIRVLLHWNTDLAQDSISHVYLGETSTLRPDLMSSDVDEIDHAEGGRQR